MRTRRLAFFERRAPPARWTIPTSPMSTRSASRTANSSSRWRSTTVAHEVLGDAARARTEYETALPLLQAEVDKNRGHGARQLSLLARAYAGLGRKEDALREAGRAVEARVGETDATIEHIGHLLSIPSGLSPGLLRIDPAWARCEMIRASAGWQSSSANDFHTGRWFGHRAGVEPRWRVSRWQPRFQDLVRRVGLPR